MDTEPMINEKKRHPNLWFRALVVLGVLLGIVLLAQTIATYYYVSRSLVLRAAERVVSQKTMTLARSLPSASTRDAARLQTAAAELRQESSGQIAWVRILDADGKLLAASGTSTATIYSPAKMRESFNQQEPLEEVFKTPSGKLLVAAHVLHVRPSGGAPGASSRVAPPPPLIVEMAVYLHTVAAPFELLRASSIIGCSAALALVIAMIAIGLSLNHYLRGKQMAGELELARRVQRELLPPTASSSKNLDFTGRCIPAWQVGGDFYDVFTVDRGQTSLVLGDIAGKGLSAALLSSLVQGAVRAVSWALRSGGFEQAVEQLNELLCFRAAPERFASLFWCQYLPEASALRYVNAGHLPPMIVHRSPAGEFEVMRLEEGGPVLGLLPQARYHAGEALVSPGDLLVMFSDGITEAMDSTGEYFGEEKLLSLVCDNWDRTPRQVCDAVLRRMRLFLGDNLPQDDQSLVVVRLEPVGSVPAISDHALATASLGTVEHAVG